MSPPQHELVVTDCNEALKLNPAYVKALNRRALALEGLERYEESLRGIIPPTLPLSLFLTSCRCRLYRRNYSKQVLKSNYSLVCRTCIEKAGRENRSQIGRAHV